MAARPPGGLSPSLGIFLPTLTTMMLVLAVGVLRSKPLFGVLLLIGACRFVLTGRYEAGIRIRDLPITPDKLLGQGP